MKVQPSQQESHQSRDAVFYGALRSISAIGDSIGDLDLVWTAESLPPTEERPPMMQNPGSHHNKLVALGKEERFFNSCCAASLLSALVFEKAQKSV
jgi:hypothetical protein